MKYILISNGALFNELYQIEDEEFFEGNAELVMYFDDSFSASEFSRNELLQQEPWTKRKMPQKTPESNINIALLEQL